MMIQPTGAVFFSECILSDKSSADGIFRDLEGFNDIPRVNHFSERQMSP
jgi:hypothetical protein